MRKINIASFLPIFLFFSFVLGIILGNIIPNYKLFFFLNLFFLGSATFFYHKKLKKYFDISALIIFLLLGSLWQISNPTQYLKKDLKGTKQVTFKVISLPQEGSRSNNFTARVVELNSRKTNFSIKVRDYTRNLQYLNIYQGKINIYYTNYSGRRFCLASVTKSSHLERVKDNFFGFLSMKTNIYLLGVLKRNCTEQAYNFLASVFLGRKELIINQRDIFAKAGASHLLAISGLHIGLTSLILFFVLRFFGIKFKISLVLSMIFLFFYTFITGFGISTLRATIMYSIFSFSFLIKRRYNLFNSLGLAGLAILFIDPSSIFNIGFQLSFLSVFAIIVSFSLFPLKAASNPIINYAKQILFCSLFVSIFITPAVSYYFGRIYLLSIVYNIILIPAFTFILLVNFILMIFSPFAQIAKSIGLILSLFIALFNYLLSFVGSIKFSFIDWSFTQRQVIFYYSFLGVFLMVFILKKPLFYLNFQKNK